MQSLLFFAGWEERGMKQKPYAVIRYVLDRKGKEVERTDISGHDMYHHACASLREAVFQETRKAFRTGRNDIFDRDGNLRTDTPYVKEWINEYCPYRWRIGNKQKIVVYEVIRRTRE